MSTNQAQKKIWSDNYQIYTFHLDNKGLSTLPVLCQFMQNSAANHAVHFGVGYYELIDKKLIWVLARQLVQIHAYPKFRDKIMVITWPSGRDRLSWSRDFKIVGPENQTIALATTIWFVIDVEQRKPQRTDSFFEFDFEDTEKVIPQKLKKLRTINSKDIEKQFQVGYWDLDLHGHVNNIRYLEWIIESYSFEFQNTHTIKEIEINYLAEAFYADQVVTSTEIADNLAFYHCINRKSDQQELCRARTVWARF